MTVSPPASVFMRLLAAYRRHGLRIRAGLNPFYFCDPDAPFAQLFTADGRQVGVGAGLAPEELHFLELLAQSGVSPARVLVIGNAFGWSSLALAMLWPTATIVAMEAALEGGETALGTDLTHRVAAEEGIRVRVVDALSPRDTGAVVQREFQGCPLDFVLIDGLHVSAQLRRDIEGVLPFLAPTGILVMHDVLSWHMTGVFRELSISDRHEWRILTRTPSGLGIVNPVNILAETRAVLDAYCDDTVDLATYFQELGATDDVPGSILESRLARGWKHGRLGMARTLAREGRPEDARRELERLATDRPGDARALYELGAWDADRGQWALAVASLRVAHALAPEWPAPAQQLGRALRECGQLDEARWYLTRAADLDPAWAPPHLELGLLANAQERRAEALAQLAKAVALAPGWSDAVREYGRMLLRQGEWVAARELLERTSERVPAEAGVIHASALVMEELDGAQAALPLFERAVSLDSSSAVFHFDLARVFATTGNLTGALMGYRQVVALRPDWPEARFDFGCALMSAGEPAEACEQLIAAMGLRPDWVDARLACGRSAYACEAWTTVLDALEPLAGTPGLTADLAHVLALATERVRGAAAALPRYSFAAQLEPDSAEVCYDLGRVSTELDDHPAALRHFSKAVRLRPAWLEARIGCGAAASRLNADARRIAATNWGDEHASALPPSPAEVFELGVVQSSSDDFATAIPSLRQAAQQHPTWVDAWLASYECATLLDDRPQAIAALSTLTDLLPRFGALWYELAFLRAHAGHGFQARQACLEAIALELRTETVKTIVHAMLGAGDAREASVVIARAIDVLPEWAGGHYLHGQTLEQLGAKELAHRAYTRAAALRPMWREAACAAARTGMEAVTSTAAA